MAIDTNKRGGYIAKNDVAAQTGGMPPKAEMTQGGVRPTRAKMGWNIGFNCLNPRTSEQTSKTDGDTAKIQKDWRKHDLPPRNAHALSENNLKMAQVRTEQRIAGVTTEIDERPQFIAKHGLDQVISLQEIVQAKAAMVERLELTSAFTKDSLAIDVETLDLLHAEVADLTTQLAAERAQIAVQNAALEEAQRDMQKFAGNSLGHQIAADNVDKLRPALDGSVAKAAELTAELAAVQATHEQVSLQVDEKRASLDRKAAQLKTVSQELAGLQPQLASAHVAYANARKEAVQSALGQFFDAYASLREHDNDKARMTAMERMLPRFADTLDLPAKYLEGLSAKEQATAMVEAFAQHKAGVHAKLGEVLEVMRNTLGEGSQGPGEDIKNAIAVLEEERASFQATFDQAKEDVADALVGRQARQLTAGRMSELPSPPLPDEVAQWSADSAKLRTLAQGYAEQARLITESMPPQLERATRLQERSMQALVTHLPHLDRIDSPELREKTHAALGKVAGNLVQSAGASALSKDAPLPPMQLVHIVEMVNSVTGGDAQRNLRLYERLTDTSVKDALRQHAEPGAELTETDRDLAALWQLSAHQVPETVTSLIAANTTGNMRPDKPEVVDWRDVQSFWRCAKEQESLGPTDAEVAHKARLGHAMRGLSAEVADGQPPAAGTLEKRYAAMAKSAVWELQTVQGIDAMMGRLVQPGVLLSTSEVKAVHGLFGAKGRGHPVEDARAEFKSTLTKLDASARDWLAHPDPHGADPHEQMAAASVLLALSEYLAAHRGTEKTHTQIKRLFTREEGTFNSGKEIWTNQLSTKEKNHILEMAGKHLAEATDSAGAGQAAALNAGAAFDRLHQLGTKHGALELLQEAVEAMATLAPGRTDEIHGPEGLKTLNYRVAVAKGGPLDTPSAVQQFIHDAIDRTELGDRMDTVSAQQHRTQVPIRVPITPHVTAGVTPGLQFGSGGIINVQANNDCVQLTLGATEEWGASLTASAAGTVKKADDHHGRKLSGPGGALRYDYKSRTDPAVVIKCSIEPDKGLRDLADARAQLKDAVDLLVTWPTLQDSQGQPYSSAFEAMADRLNPPPTIDWERRDYTGHAVEGAVTAGLSVELGIKQLTVGAAVTAKAGMTHDVMDSINQQGAAEKYTTDKNYAKVEAFVGVSTPANGVNTEDPKTHVKTNHPTTGNEHAGILMNFGIGGFVTANVGGQEVKDKFPVGTDRYKAYKLEYGLFGRDMDTARDLVFATLPQVARRVQDVCKGVGLDAELTTLMEAEVLMNFARMLDEDKTDRFSTKAESSQQWAHRGLDAGIAMARGAGDDETADLLTQVRDSITANNKDQAVKYFVAAGELAMKKNSWGGKRTEVKSMREDPVPDTRTSTLHPTAERLRQEQQRAESLPGWQARIVQSALPPRPAVLVEPTGTGPTPGPTPGPQTPPTTTSVPPLPVVAPLDLSPEALARIPMAELGPQLPEDIRSALPVAMPLDLAAVPLADFPTAQPVDGAGLTPAQRAAVPMAELYQTPPPDVRRGA